MTEVVSTARAGVNGESRAPKKLSRVPFDQRDMMVLAGALAFAAICAAVVGLGGIPTLQPLVGLTVIMAFAYAMSTDRRAIDRRTVAWGLSLQLIFALLVLKTTVGQRVFATLGTLIPAAGLRVRRIVVVFGARRHRSSGPDHDKGPRTRRRALRRHLRVQVLPTIVFIAALFAILYYFGVMQLVVRLFAI
jgi:CNT family concentrative nucleoside transporter